MLTKTRHRDNCLTVFLFFSLSLAGGAVQKAQLFGAGQIIGVSDTGIDHDHCFFHDPSTAVPFNTINKNHRKIVLYDTVLGDNKVS